VYEDSLRSACVTVYAECVAVGYM